MWVLEPKVYHKMPEEVLKGQDVIHYKKCLREVKNLYKYSDSCKLDPNTLVYEVYSYTEGEEKKQGNLFWGLTVMYPIYINDECNMTRGHFHENRNCAEFYFGLKGEGLLLLMNKEGEMWAERICEGSLHHIDGEIAHRIVNVSDDKLMVGACWPTTSGHDYQSIERNEFPYRVFKSNGRIKFVKK